MADITTTYSQADTVGIKIHQADRTNMDMSPCKIKEKVDKSGKSVYRLYTPAGIINILYRVEDLAAMNNVCFSKLSGIGTDTYK